MFFWQKPSRLRCELTNICNHRCVMCGIWAETPKVTLDLELFDRLLGDRVLDAVRVLSLTGGEPFALPNLADYYEVARRRHRRAHINISSNGWYTARALELFERVRPRNTSLTISYDGFASHDSIRGVDGSTERLLETARNVQREFPEVTLSLKMVVTNDNHREILDTAREADELGVAFRLKTLEKLKCHQSRSPSEVSEPDYADDVVGSIADQARRLLDLGVETNSSYLKKLLRMSEGKTVSCNCSPRTLFVGVDGKVFLCRRKEEIGNVHDRSLDGIWQSAARTVMLSRMRHCQGGLFSLSYVNV